jgi:hypothetical protein
MSDRVQFCLLGPLVVRCNGLSVPIAPGKQRSLLALLQLAGGGSPPSRVAGRAGQRWSSPVGRGEAGGGVRSRSGVVGLGIGGIVGGYRWLAGQGGRGCAFAGVLAPVTAHPWIDLGVFCRYWVIRGFAGWR